MGELEEGMSEVQQFVDCDVSWVAIQASWTTPWRD